MSEFFLPVAQEMSALANRERRRRTTREWRKKAQQNPEVARRLKKMRSAYPWVKPGALAPLALAGENLDSPIVKEVADAAARRAQRTGQWATPGEVQNAAAVRVARNGRVPDEKIRRYVSEFGEGGPDLGDLADVTPVVGSAKAILEGNPMLGAARLLPGFGVAEKLTIPAVQEAAKVTGTTNELKGVSRGVMMGMQFGNDAVSALVRQVASGKGVGVTTPVYAPTAGDPTRVDSGGMSTEGIQAIAQSAEQSQAVQAIIALGAGERVDVGEGWFPDYQSATARAAAKAARESGAPLINGSAFTLGRWVANSVGLDSDELGYKLLSGGVDAWIAVRADPLNPLFDSWTRSRKVSNRVTGLQTDVEAAASAGRQRVTKATKDLTKAEAAAAKVADDAAKELEDYVPSNLFGDFETLPPKVPAGPSAEELTDLAARAREGRADVTELEQMFGAHKSHRYSYDSKTVEQVLASEAGSQQIDLTILESSPGKIWRGFNKRVTPEFADDIAEAGTEKGQQAEKLIAQADELRVAGNADEAARLDDEAAKLWSEARDETKAVWRAHLGLGVPEIVRYQPPKVLNNGHESTRLGYLLKERFPKDAQIRLGDRQRTLSDVDDWLRNMGVRTSVRDDIADKVISAKTGPEADEMVDAIHDAGKAALGQHGFTDEEADLLMKWSASEQNSQKVFAVTDLVEGRVRNPASRVDPENPDRIISDPMLDNEFLSRTVMLPDARAMRHATRNMPWFPSWERSFARNAAYQAQATKLRQKLATLDEIDGVAVKKPADFDQQVAKINSELADLAHKQKINDRILAAGRIGVGMGAGVDSLMSYWRTYKLLRFAWGVRVVGEEAARLGAFGYSTLQHPLDYFLILAGTKPNSRLGKVFEAFKHSDEAARNALRNVGIDLGDPKYATRRLSRDPTHALFEDVDLHNEAMNSALVDNLTGRHRTTVTRPWEDLDEFERIFRGDSRTYTAWAQEYRRLTSSKIVRGILQFDNPRDAREWFLRGEGAKWRKFLADDPTYVGIDTDDVFANKYFDSVWDRILYHTGEGDQRLIDAIKTGRIGDVSVGNTDELAKILEGSYSRYTPEQLRAIKERSVVSGYKFYKQSQDAKKSSIIDMIMYQIMPRPSNYFNRSPLYRQHMWREEVPDLMTFADAKTQKKVLDAASQGGLTKAELDHLRSIPAHVGEGTITSADELTQLAHMRSLSRTKEILYDMSEKGQIFDLLRNIIPFGEAWREVITRWARAVKDNPRIIHRLDQGIQSGREEGFFHKDIVSGQEMYSIPGSSLVNGMVAGVPVPFTGSLSGLNMVGNITPGVGPILTMPAAYLWKSDPNSSAHRMAEEFLFPYGRNYTGNPLEDIATDFAPTWLKWFNQAAQAPFSNPEDSRKYASTFQSAVDYHYSTGNFKLNSSDPEVARSERARLLDTAKKSTSLLFLVRGLASGVLPSAPVPKWVLRDRNSNLVEMDILKSEFYDNMTGNKEKGIKAVGADAATDMLLAKYGPSVLMATIPRSSSEAIHPRTEGGNRFLSKREWMADIAPEVYGAFVPESGEYDLAGYDSSFGKPIPRKLMSSQDRLDLGNHRLASWAYDYYFEDADPDSEEAKAYRDQLKREFPGFNAKAFDYTQTETRINELRSLSHDKRVIADPELKNVAEFTRAYLSARDDALEAAPYSLKAKGSTRQREWLIEYAESLYLTSPEFRRVWDQILRWEFNADQLPAWANKIGT